jgi:hypothetical protein
MNPRVPNTHRESFLLLATSTIHQVPVFSCSYMHPPGRLSIQRQGKGIEIPRVILLFSAWCLCHLEQSHRIFALGTPSSPERCPGLSFGGSQFTMCHFSYIITCTSLLLIGFCNPIVILGGGGGPVKRERKKKKKDE